MASGLPTIQRRQQFAYKGKSQAAVQCRWDSVQMITKRTFVKRVETSTFVDRLAYSHGPTNHRDGTGCPTSLRAQNADEVDGSRASRGQQ
jgi:hypothetical protein